MFQELPDGGQHRVHPSGTPNRRRAWSRQCDVIAGLSMPQRQHEHAQIAPDVQRPGCFARGVIAVRGPGMATPTRPGPQVMIISPGWVVPAHGRGRSPFGGRV